MDSATKYTLAAYAVSLLLILGYGVLLTVRLRRHTRGQRP